MFKDRWYISIQFYCKSTTILRVKEFENRSTFGEVMEKSIAYCFLTVYLIDTEKSGRKQ